MAAGNDTRIALESRQEASRAVLRNIEQYGVPDAPGMERRIMATTEFGSYRLSGTNLIRACAYMREHPLWSPDARFIPIGELMRLGLRPMAGTSPLLIEEAVAQDDRDFGLRLRRFYPAERIEGLQRELQQEPLAERMEAASMFLASKGHAPDNDESAESILHAFEEYGMDRMEDTPEAGKRAKAGLFA